METLFTLTVIVTVVMTIVGWMRVSHWTQRALKAEEKLVKISGGVEKLRQGVRALDFHLENKTNELNMKIEAMKGAK